MTANRDLKFIIRDRQRKTGESYTAARAHVMRERAQLLGLASEPAPVEPAQLVDAAVLKVGSNTARLRILGESEQVTLRSGEAFNLAPGQIVTLRLAKRWTFRGDAYVSGSIDRARIDVARLGLEPLPLEGGELENLRARGEHYRRPDPYAPLWRELTAAPRPSYEMDGIAWGAFPGDEPDDNPTCEAAERKDAGDLDGARDLLMDTLLRDLRCLDAHAHLGNLLFEGSPIRAIVHYEIGVRIGELSLPPEFDGTLVWANLQSPVPPVPLRPRPVPVAARSVSRGAARVRAGPLAESE